MVSFVRCCCLVRNNLNNSFYIHLFQFSFHILEKCVVNSKKQMSKETKKNSLLEKNADFDDFDWSRVPDDVESAILLLRQRFPPLIFARQSKLKPVLVSQLYSILDNKTLVDTRLSELIEERKLRKIRLLVRAVSVVLLLLCLLMGLCFATFGILF